MKLTKEKNRIICQIELVDDMALYDLLFKIYVLDYDYEKFAEYRGCSTKTVDKYHKKALLKFEEMFGNEYLS